MFTQRLCAVSNVSCTSNVSRALIQTPYDVSGALTMPQRFINAVTIHASCHKVTVRSWSGPYVAGIACTEMNAMAPVSVWTHKNG